MTDLPPRSPLRVSRLNRQGWLSLEFREAKEVAFMLNQTLQAMGRNKLGLLLG